MIEVDRVNDPKKKRVQMVLCWNFIETTPTLPKWLLCLKHVDHCARDLGCSVNHELINQLMKFGTPWAGGLLIRGRALPKDHFFQSFNWIQSEPGSKTPVTSMRLPAGSGTWLIHAYRFILCCQVLCVFSTGCHHDLVFLVWGMAFCGCQRSIHAVTGVKWGFRLVLLVWTRHPEAHVPTEQLHVCYFRPGSGQSIWLTEEDNRRFAKKKERRERRSSEPLPSLSDGEGVFEQNVLDLSWSILNTMWAMWATLKCYVLRAIHSSHFAASSSFQGGPQNLWARLDRSISIYHIPNVRKRAISLYIEKQIPN